MREFLDVYYWTAESGITPRDDPFPPTDPLPDIGQNTQVSMGSRKPSHVGSVFRKVLVLVTKHMNIRRVIINHGFVWLHDLWNISIINDAAVVIPEKKKSRILSCLSNKRNPSICRTTFSVPMMYPHLPCTQMIYWLLDARMELLSFGMYRRGRFKKCKLLSYLNDK